MKETGHTIKVTNLDGTEHTYSEENEYGWQCTLKFIVIPEDANVVLTVNGEMKTDNPITIPYYSQIDYSISREGYLEEIGSILLDKNMNIEISLEENTVNEDKE